MLRFRRGKQTSECMQKIELIEKDTLYLKGKKRDKARRKYLELLISCKKECGLEEPIYLERDYDE